MADEDAKAKAWQKRLEVTFTEDGVIGGKLLTHTIAAEQRISTHDSWCSSTALKE
jgi:hypothetical protein